MHINMSASEFVKWSPFYSTDKTKFPWAFYAGHNTHIHEYMNACMKIGIGPCADSKRSDGNFAFSNKNFVRITADFRKQTNESCVICEYWRLHLLNAFNFQQSISTHSRDAWCHHTICIDRARTNQVSPSHSDCTPGRSTDANNAQHICKTEAAVYHFIDTT